MFNVVILDSELSMLTITSTHGHILGLVQRLSAFLMPRPSLKSTRSETILEAFVTCVARYGIEGSTQERIAKESGIKRPLIRHYLGNRDQMVDALIDYMGAKFDEDTEAVFQNLPEENRIEALLDMMLDYEGAATASMSVVYESIVACASQYPKARTMTLDCTARLLAALEQELRAAFPHATAEEISATAYGIFSVSICVESLAPVNPPDAWVKSARMAVRSLVQALDEKTAR